MISNKYFIHSTEHIYQHQDRKQKMMIHENHDHPTPLFSHKTQIYNKHLVNENAIQRKKVINSQNTDTQSFGLCRNTQSPARQHQNVGMYSIVQFSSVQFSSRWYICASKSSHALHPVSQKFPQCCLDRCL